MIWFRIIQTSGDWSMKRSISLSVVAFSLCVCLLTPAIVFAQGDIHPPASAMGTNGPIATMKSLNQIEPRIHISSIPFVIDRSGSYYLTESLTAEGTANGITIDSDDVEVDLNGFALVGGDAGSNGILVPNIHHNVTIRNGVLRGWQGYGLAGQNTFESQAIKVTAFDNQSGGLELSGHCLFQACGAYKNGGPGIVSGDQSTIIGSKALDNVRGSTGIVVTDNCRVIDCDAARNAMNGIEVGRFSIVKECTAVGNTGTGIVATAHCRLVNNIAASNDIGIYLAGNGNRADGNQLAKNRIGIQSAGGNLVVRNSASENSETAFGTFTSDQIGASQLESGQIQAGTPWANFTLSP
jgi:parallel beta-helix repeat protein